MQSGPLEDCTALPIVASDLENWSGHITGPPGTPYAQRTLAFEMVFPDAYPLQPMAIAFVSPIPFHPNISSETGVVQMRELNWSNWSPVLTVPNVLICLQALLSDPELEFGVVNEEAKRLYVEDRGEFERRASAQ